MTFRLSVFLCLTALFVQGQTRPAGPEVAKYWLLLTDKEPDALPALSPTAIAQRKTQNLPLDETDQPVSASYLALLKQAGVQPICQSRWLNAVSVRLTPQQYAQVVKLPFVKGVQAIDPAIVIASTRLPANPQLAPVMSQIQAPDFTKAGLTGRFVNIGVIDAGFLVPTLPMRSGMCSLVRG